MQQILDMLNQPFTKSGLLILGGFALKKWPAFFNKAIPAAVVVLSAVMQALTTAFPDVAGPVQPAAYMAAAFTTESGVGGFVLGTLVPAVLSVGAHSKWKNIVEWASYGFRIFNK